jgi:hypothetical protein
MWFFPGSKKPELRSEADKYVLVEKAKWRRRRRFYWSSLAIFVFGLIATFGAWMIIYSSAFRVSELRISGNEFTSSDAVRNYLDTKILSASLPNALLGFDNMLSWRNSLLESHSPELPRVKEIKIDKQYLSHAVNISVTERTPYGIWCDSREAGIFEAARVAEAAVVVKEEDTPENASTTVLPNQNCYWFDKEGFLLDAAPHAAGNLIPVVHDYSGKFLRSQTKAEDASLIANLISVFEALKMMDLSVREVRLENRGLDEVKVILESGPQLYFSLRFPAIEAVPVVMNLRRNTSSNQFSSLQYVDFRVEHRAYYK